MILIVWFFFHLCKDKQKITLNIHSMRQSYLTLFRNTHLNKTMRSMTLVSQQKVPSGGSHKLQRRLSKHTAPYGDKTGSQRLVWSFYASPCKDKMEKLPAKHDSLPESAPSALLPFTCLVFGTSWTWAQRARRRRFRADLTPGSHLRREPKY